MTCPNCNDNRSYRIGNRTVVCVCEIRREADLIAKSAVYHARQMVLHGAARPEPADNMGKWLMGRKAA